ncbi:MAG: family 16 glycoside hydrolase, partial [Planctomycetota bacterium]
KGLDMLKSDIERARQVSWLQGKGKVGTVVMLLLLAGGLLTGRSLMAKSEFFDVRAFDLKFPKDGALITDTQTPTLNWEESFVITDELIAEDLDSKPSGELVWEAEYKGDDGYVRLVESESYTRGKVDYSKNPGRRFGVKFDFWVSEETGPGEGNGGVTWFYAYEQGRSRSPDHSKGYSVAFDNYNSKIKFHADGEVVASTRATEFSDSSWHTAEIVVVDGDITLYVDGEKRLQHEAKEVDMSGEIMGFAGRCGGSKSEQRIRNMKVMELKPVDHYEVHIDGSRVGTTENLSYEVDPLSYGEHSWRVFSVTEDGEKRESERTLDMAIRKGVSVALAGETQTDEPEHVKDTLETWRSNPHYPAWEFSAHVGDFIAGDISKGQVNEEAIEKSVELFTNHLTTFSVQVIGINDVGDWQENPDKAHKTLQDIMNETGMPARTFAFEYDNILFINLDVMGGGRKMAPGTFAWLANLTERYSEKPTVILSRVGSSEFTGDDEGEKQEHAFFGEEKEDVSEFWKEFLSQDQIVGWFHGSCENTDEDFLDKNYNVTSGNMVEVAIPRLGGTSDMDHLSGHVQITSDAIYTNIWNEQKEEIVATKAESGYDLEVSDEGFGSIFIPRYVKDGEEWEYTNQFGAKEVTLNLIGMEANDLVYHSAEKPAKGKTEDFTVKFNGERFSASEALGHNELASFDMDAVLMDRVNTTEVAISGNKIGLVEIQYSDPVLYSQHAAVGIEEVNDDELELNMSRVAQYNDKTRYFPLTDVVETSLPENDEYKHVFYQVPGAAFMFSSTKGVITKTVKTAD